MKISQHLAKFYNTAKDKAKRAKSKAFGKDVQQLSTNEHKQHVQQSKHELMHKGLEDSPLPAPPFSLKKQDLVARFKTGKATEADKAFIEQELKLKYNRLDNKFSPPERIQTRMEQEIEKRFMDVISDTKRFIELIATNRLQKEDHQLLNAFGLKAHADGSLEVIKELPLNLLEKKLCEAFDGGLKHIKHIDAIQDPALKHTIRLIRTGLYPEHAFSEQVQEQLRELHLKIENGKLVG